MNYIRKSYSKKQNQQITISQDEFDTTNDYLNELSGWSNNQYNPGYWTGGNIPPHIKHGGKLGGFALLATGLFTILPAMMMLIVSFPENIFKYVLLLLVGVIAFTAGFKKIRSS